MKSQLLKKKTVKSLKEGSYTSLINIIEEAIDLYGEKEFERGYQSFFGDASVHASRIASDIYCAFRDSITLTEESMAKIIEEYFNSLKTE